MLGRLLYKVFKLISWIIIIFVFIILLSKALPLINNLYHKFLSFLNNITNNFLTL